MRTLKELAQEALEIQNACNLCGLAQRFAKVMIELGEYTNGTEARNTHPIVSLWLDKFNSLNKVSIDGINALSKDYEYVEYLAKGL